MKSRLIILIFLLLGPLLQAQTFNEIQQVFWSQIRHSCVGELSFQKTVSDLEGGVKAETKILLIDCRSATARDEATGEAFPLDNSELKWLFDYSFSNPYLEDYLDVKRSGKSVTAKVKPGMEGNSELQEQVFQFSEETGRIEFASAMIKKGSMLYDLEIKVKVWFDGNGNYLRHETETLSEVILSGKVHTLISGKKI